MKNREDSDKMLVKFFGSTSRARILSLLLTHPGTSFYQREVMYETALSLQAVQRELANLVKLGFVQRRDGPNRVYYEINPASPLIESLREMVRYLDKTEKASRPDSKER